jgi:hypothetical protein
LVSTAAARFRVTEPLTLFIPPKDPPRYTVEPDTAKADTVLL